MLLRSMLSRCSVLFERHELSSVVADSSAIALIVAFALFLFTMYSIVPFALVLGGSALLNINLLTSDAYAILAAEFLFHSSVRRSYPPFCHCFIIS